MPKLTLGFDVNRYVDVNNTTSQQTTWKPFLISFLDNVSVSIINPAQLEPGEIHIDNYYKSEYRVEVIDFIKNSDYCSSEGIAIDNTDSTMELVKNQFNIDDELARGFNIQLFHSCLHSEFEALHKLGLVEHRTVNLPGKLEEIVQKVNDSHHYDSYMITSQGLEVALKIQEHMDKDEQFSQQIAISAQLKRNSNLTVAISSVVGVIAMTALYFNLSNLEINQRRLNLMESKMLVDQKYSKELDVTAAMSEKFEKQREFNLDEIDSVNKKTKDN